MDKYKTAYLKETMGLLCQACNTMVTKCDKCRNAFSFSDRIYCNAETDLPPCPRDHLCQNCYARELKNAKK